MKSKRICFWDTPTIQNKIILMWVEVNLHLFLKSCHLQQYEMKGSIEIE